MIQITNEEFNNTVRSLRKVTIKSSLVGHARLTSYYQGKRVVGLVREYKAVKTYWSNRNEKY